MDAFQIQVYNEELYNLIRPTIQCALYGGLIDVAVYFEGWTTCEIVKNIHEEILIRKLLTVQIMWSSDHNVQS